MRSPGPAPPPATTTMTTTARVLAEYGVSKTLGAGSMGKVKLAVHHATGQKVAIKIIPRPRPLPPPAQVLPPPQTTNNSGLTDVEREREREKEKERMKQVEKDASKEQRTRREAALASLLYHPYVCPARAFLSTPTYHYMVFDYVSGGQLLDYIIAHGKLKERLARTFARQIGSALAYCHANSVVHRDLKIENILLSASGNIKLIDFGLSNLWSPNRSLQTFCGSLYFAAPELLNARPYVGPEVDVWSFGIVLYVLVCGKVPFDDQSMPALHAKIKKGHVDYPSGLSSDCKHILSRMLVTNPAARATLPELLSHPWMTRSFGRPPALHLTTRDLLDPDALDPDVIAGMTGFDLGSAQDVHDKLADVLRSPTYLAALRAYQQARSNVSLTDQQQHPPPYHAAEDVAQHQTHSRTPSHPHTHSSNLADLKREPTKRFSTIGLFGKKVLEAITHPVSPSLRSPGSPSGTSQDSPRSVAAMSAGRYDSVQPPPTSPSYGFDPLISIYFLVKEKRDREALLGQPMYASSVMSVFDTDEQRAAKGVDLTAVKSLASSPSDSGSMVSPPPPQPSFAALPSVKRKIPTITVPAQTAAPNFRNSFAMPSPSPSSPLFPSKTDVPQARAKIIGEAGIMMQPLRGDRENTHLNLVESSSPSAGATKSPRLPTKPQTATHRRSQSLTQPTSMPVPSPQVSQSPSFSSWMQSTPTSPAFASTLPRSTQSPAAATSSLTQSERKRSTAAVPTTEQAQYHYNDFLIPIPAPSSSAHHPTTKSSGPARPPPEANPATPSNLIPAPIVIAAADPLPAAPAESPSASAPSHPGLGKRLSSLLSRTASQRRSILTRSASRRDNTEKDGVDAYDAVRNDDAEQQVGDKSMNNTTPSRRSGMHGLKNRIGSVGSNYRQKRDRRPSLAATLDAMHLENEQQRVREEHEAPHISSAQIKPVWMKGLFSVATTTTKPIPILCKDLMQVLRSLGISYVETADGFECIKLPSITMPNTPNNPTGQQFESSTMLDAQLSRISRYLAHSGDDMQLASHDDASRINGHATNASLTRVPLPPSSTQRNLKTPATPGAIQTDVFDDQTLSKQLATRFDITIVKVPWLPTMYGLQFRKTAGDVWRYKQLAQRVLDAFQA